MAGADVLLTGERTWPGVAEENYWFRRHEAAYRWVAAAVPVRGAVVLEAGCGEGYGAGLLAAAGAELVVGADLDRRTLAHVRGTYPAVRPVRANLVALPLADAAVDIVVASQVVEHLWDQDAFVGECARVLRPGGRLVLTTPNRRTFPPGNPFHSRELDAAELAALVAPWLVVERVLGVRHGPRLVAEAAREGDLVTAQIGAGRVEGRLADRVAAVTVDDFVVDGLDDSLDDDALAGCLDLVLVAVRR
jgi:SAM-dependent methyltransferase